MNTIKNKIVGFNHNGSVIVHRILAKRYLFLLLSLVLLISIPSFLYESEYQNTASYMLQSLVFFAGAYAIHQSDRELYFLVILCGIVMILTLFKVHEQNASLNFYVGFVFYLFFYLFTCYRLVKIIFKAKEVQSSVLFASVNVYLLFGICGGFAFMLIENIHPGSLNNLQLENITNPSKFIYFSFVTLSTLGYGEITPATPPAQSFVILLTVTGQMYITFIVAMLVGRFLSSKDHN